MRAANLLILLFALAPVAMASDAKPGDAAPPAVARPAGPEVKPPPAVPPGKAAKAVAAITLVNAGFESTAPGKLGAPEGWWVAQHAGPVSYRFEPDTAVKHSGERSLRVTNVGPEPFGSVYQTLPAVPWRGRTLRFSAWLRTKDTAGNFFGSGAGLKLYAMRSGYPVQVADMQRDAVHGTTEWTRYELTLRIPQEAEILEVGLVLFGPGTAWLDDVALDVLDGAREAVERPQAPATRGP